MKITEVSQCKTSYDFGPLTKWPESLPAFAWGEELICGFDRPASHKVIDLKGADGSFVEAFADIYKNLSLAEFARIYALNFLSDEQLSLLLQKNSFRPAETLFDLFVKLSATPRGFQDWTSDKKLGAKELFILKSVSDISSVETFLRTLAAKNPSRQVGIQILENALELFMMGHFEILALDGEFAEVWCERLHQKRHPLLTTKLEEKQSNLSRLGWPKFINARVVQHQASLVNELRLQFRNPAELKRNIEALQKIHIEIESARK